MLFPGDIELTRTRRLRGTKTDLQRLETLNALSRRCCAAPMAASELRSALAECNAPRSPLTLYIGSALAAGSFAVFFGGGILDGVVAALFGLLICCLQEHLPGLCPNSVIVYFLSALVTGFGVCLLSKGILLLRPDKIMIGDIMLLIPGIALTTAIRNILVGDTISGILKLTESLVYAMALAGGFMLAIGLLGV